MYVKGTIYQRMQHESSSVPRTAVGYQVRKLFLLGRTKPYSSVHRKDKKRTFHEPDPQPNQNDQAANQAQQARQGERTGLFVDRQTEQTGLPVEWNGLTSPKSRCRASP